jgi:ATP-binding cassette subfamily B protein
VSFALRPGERIALVGENGAGKTTLTKLLARLYDPTEGRILLDGVDLRDYDLASLRREIGVIFQDFVRYDMRFDENVGVGEIESVREYLDNGASAPTPAPLVHAAEESLASSLLPRFPGGYRRCSAADSRTAWTFPVASGRRSRSGVPTCATRRC